MSKKRTGMSRETRVFDNKTFEIRANADGSHTITGTASPFNSPSVDLGGFTERVSPGAYTQTLKDRPDVVILWNHDTGHPLGRVSSGTAKVWEDERGLQISCKLPDTQTGRDLAALMQRGDVHSMSIGFRVPSGGDTWEQQGDQTIRTIREAILYECSVVTLPAFEATSVSLRSCPADLRSKLALRDGNSDDDDDDDDSDFSDLDDYRPECDPEHEDYDEDADCPDDDDDDEQDEDMRRVDQLRIRALFQHKRLNASTQ